MNRFKIGDTVIYAGNINGIGYCINALKGRKYKIVDITNTHIYINITETLDRVSFYIEDFKPVYNNNKLYKLILNG